MGSARNGCEGCKLILDTQRFWTGSNVTGGVYDLGPLPTQINVSGSMPCANGSFHITHSQSARSYHYNPSPTTEEKHASDVVTWSHYPFFSSRLAIAADAGMFLVHSEYVFNH